MRKKSDSTLGNLQIKREQLIEAEFSSRFEVMILLEENIELRLAKRRKLDSKTPEGVTAGENEPFYPFRLVPSPQEARPLETSIGCVDRC